MLADLLLGPLDHAMALAGLREKHFSGASDLEALLGARLGLQLGHLALLYPARIVRATRPGSADVARNEQALELVLVGIVLSKSPPRQPLISRAARGRGYGRGGP